MSEIFAQPRVLLQLNGKNDEKLLQKRKTFKKWKRLTSKKIGTGRRLELNLKRFLIK